MPSHFRSLLSSKPFEIKSSDNSYFIHKDILSSRLELGHITTGETDGVIDLSDWGSDTVGLFAEFLYTGDYILEALPDEDGETGRWHRSGTPDTAQSLANDDTNVLLVHAKVYALAQHKNVEALRVMAFERLKKALEGVDRDRLGGISRVTTDVIGLLEYVYSSYADIQAEPHEGSDTESDTGSEDHMRDLVSKFAAENIEKLTGRGEVTTLLRGDGDFAVELMDRIGGRLCDPEKLCALEKEVEDWKNRASTSEEKLRQSEAENKKIAELEANAKTMQEAEKASKEKIQQLETTIAERVRELEAANTEKRQLLEKVKTAEAAKPPETPAAETPAAETTAAAAP